jgi:AraC family transcriptional regulator, transcriptional activator of pobA
VVPSAATRVPLVRFSRAKYGRELLIDADMVSAWPDFEQHGRPHRLDFYDLLLITSGTARLAIDAETHTLSPGTVLVTRPGQVRQWVVGGADGACIFFTTDFVSQIFTDPRFLETFAFLRPGRPMAAFKAGPAAARDYLQRFRTMRREIHRMRDDAPHKLRAVLYDLLVLLDRRYRRVGRPVAGGDDDLTTRFRAAVDARFHRQHLVAPCAHRLGVTPGYLTARCRTLLGRTAGALIRERIVLEAQRQLRYSSRTIAEIAEGLGFDDPSYFTRFFLRETGHLPTAVRGSLNHDRQKVPFPKRSVHSR